MAKRSVTVAGHRTSISLEAPFWDAIGEIAAVHGLSVPALIAEIDRGRPPDVNLSAAVRLHCLAWYRERGRSGG